MSGLCDNLYVVLMPWFDWGGGTVSLESGGWSKIILQLAFVTVW